jgi:hypothetical protein
MHGHQSAGTNGARQDGAIVGRVARLGSSLRRSWRRRLR